MTMQTLKPMCRVRRKVARPKVAKEKARERARVALKPLKLLLPLLLRRTKWTSLVMIPRLTPLPPKP